MNRFSIRLREIRFGNVKIFFLYNNNYFIIFKRIIIIFFFLIFFSLLFFLILDNQEQMIVVDSPGNAHKGKLKIFEQAIEKIRFLN